MSKIKNALKITGISALTLFGAEKVLAQDVTQAASDNAKKIEIAQSVKADTTLEKIKVDWPGQHTDDQDSTKDFNRALATINNKKVGDEITESDTTIKIYPNKEGKFYQAPSFQLKIVKSNLNFESAKFDTSTKTLPDKRKPNLETITIDFPGTPKSDLDTSNGFKNDNNYNPAKIKVENIKLSGEIAESKTNIKIIPSKKHGFYQDSSSQVRTILEDIESRGLNYVIGYEGSKTDTTETILIPNRRNIIYSKDPEVTFAGNGSIKVKYTETFPLTPSTKIILNEDSTRKGDITYKYVDGVKGLKDWLLVHARTDTSEKEIAFRNHVRNVLLPKAKKNPSDSLSLILLNRALEDGVMDCQADSLIKNREWQVKNGIYILTERSKGKIITVNGSNLIYTPESGLDIQHIQTFQDNNAVIPGRGKTVIYTGNNANDTTGQGRTAIAVFPTKQFGNGATPFIPTPEVPEPPKPKTSEIDSSKKSRTRIIVGGHAGQSGLKGIDLGLQVGRVAVVGSYSVGGNDNVERITGSPSSTGMTGNVRTDKTNYKGIGGALEYHPSDFFVGAGLESWKYATIRGVKITRSDGTSKRKTEPEESNSEIAAKGYVGYGKNISKNIKLEGIAGYDSYKKAFVGARLNRKF